VARGFGGPGGRGGFGGGTHGGGFPGGAVPGGAVPGGAVPGGAVPGGAVPGGGAPAGTAQPGGTGQPGGGFTGGGGFGRGGGGGGGARGLLDAPTVSDQLKTILNENASSYTWVAATIGSQTASGYQLATGKSVMPIGGFNGSDPSPTLAQFQQYVAQGKIHYFIAGGGFGGGQSMNGSNDSSLISAWVAANFTAQTVGDTTIYNLSQSTTA
jgi:hypothetical protein